MIQKVLDHLNIPAKVVNTIQTDMMTRYLIETDKIAKVERAARDIAIGIRAPGIPTVTPLYSEGLIAVDFINNPDLLVDFFEILNHINGIVPVALGKDYQGNPFYKDLVDFPHVLISGTTGSGKTVMLHSIICSIIYYNLAKLVLIDPKMVEFLPYTNIRQLLFPVVNTPADAFGAIKKLIDVMEERFSILHSANVSTIQEYNKKKKPLDYIVVVIDEYSDLIYTAKKEFQNLISRLAQKCRACGIHIIIATQRPSADVVTGVVKANFPTKISFRVSSAINSRVVLDEKGAECLLGRGDGMIKDNLGITRFKGAFISPDDIKLLCSNNLTESRNWLVRLWKGLFA